MNRFILAFFAIILMVSCQEGALSPARQADDVDLYTSMEDVNLTKTSMDDNNNVLWTKGDEVVAFLKNSYGSRYYVNDSCSGSTNGVFSKSEENGDILGDVVSLDHNVVLYPYSSSVTCKKIDTLSDSYELVVQLPETQYYVADTFGNGSFPMVAVSGSNILTFKNVCGGIKLQLTGVDKVRSITLEGADGEKVSGAAAVTAKANGAPSIEMSSTANASVILDCGTGGVQLDENAPTTFIVSVPPMTFESGMKITITDTDGLSRTLTNSESNTVTRSTLLTFPIIAYEPEDTRVNNKIYYKTTDEKIVKPSSSAKFGAKLLSNTYKNGQGVMVFDGDVTEIGEEAFRSCSTLKEIQLPSTLTRISYEAFIYCSNLESPITIPESVTFIDERAFMGCNKVPAYYGKYASSDNTALVEDGAMLAVAVAGKEEYTIPSEVTVIGNWMFYDCTELKSLTIHDNVTKIGDYAVYYCRSLESVKIGENVTSIGKEAFWAADSIDHLVVPAKVTYVGGQAFNTRYLKSITFLSETPPNFAQYYYTFGDERPLIYVPSQSYSQYYDALPPKHQTHLIAGTRNISTDYSQKEIRYNSNTTVSLYQMAFSSNRVVSQYASSGKGVIKFTSDITVIDKFAFKNNRSLAAISFPEGVTELGPYLFSGCDNLTSVVIPSSVTSIGKGILESSSYNFRSLYCKAVIPPTLDTDLTGYSDIKYFKIYVPNESVEAYKTADVWENYADIIVGIE